MIHAFLFLTARNTDRTSHGPNFVVHMHRINKISGANVTIFHNFADEVDNYRVHWWKCNGKCVKWPPFYGIVKRAMNRPPGPNDFWFPRHEKNCGGQFLMIKEPRSKIKEKKVARGNKDSVKK